MVVGIVLQVFQREVFQFAFQFVQTQFVGKGRIEIGSLLRHPSAVGVIIGVTYLPHQVHAAGNHDEYHPHVLGKGQQQVAEVLALYDRCLLIEFGNALQTVQDACHRLAKLVLHLVDGDESTLYTGMEQDGEHRIALQSDFLHHDECRLEPLEDGIVAKNIALHLVCLDTVHQMGTHLLLVSRLERGTNQFS